MTLALDQLAASSKSKAGTRSERITIRPFDGVDTTASALETVRISLNDASHKAGSIVVSDETLSKAALSLLLPAPVQLREAVKAISLRPEDCGLIVMCSSKTHRTSSVVLKERLTEDAHYPTELNLSRGELDLILNDRGGFRVTVAIALLYDIPAEPLKPSIAGTWLGRADFSLSPEKQDTSFSPEELSEEVRDAYDLPNGVLRFITFDDDLLAVEDLSEAIRVFVDPKVLHTMLANDTDKVALQQQTELAIMVYDATAQKIVREIRIEYRDAEKVLSESDIKPYPAAHRFFHNLASRCQRSLPDMLRLASEGQLIKPFLEASFNATGQTLDALKG